MFARALRRFSTQKYSVNTAYLEKYLKHRNVMKLYDLWPNHGMSFVAPNAALIGEVYVGNHSAIYYGAVIRGDINKVRIMDHTSIGMNTVIHTAPSLPTGASAATVIGCNTYIGPNCTLYSCHIDDFVTVGAGSVILEGARLEKACVIGPNSVVPPGRLIPAKQLWAGNPVKYIKDIYEADEAFTREMIGKEAGKMTYHRG